MQLAAVVQAVHAVPSKKKPALQVALHTPLVQVALLAFELSHVFPHAPQLAGSLASVTQLPPPQVSQLNDRSGTAERSPATEKSELLATSFIPASRRPSPPPQAANRNPMTAADAPAFGLMTPARCTRYARARNEAKEGKPLHPGCVVARVRAKHLAKRQSDDYWPHSLPSLRRLSTVMQPLSPLRLSSSSS